MAEPKKGQRVAIVAGLRTPFAKRGTAYRDLSALELGEIVVHELLERSAIDAREVRQVVFGQVIPSVAAPNIAREIVLGADMPRDIEAYSVSRACATSFQSAVNVAEAIGAGTIDCGIAGGADSASDVPVTLSKRLATSLEQFARAKDLPHKLKAFKGLAPTDLQPKPPALEELSTGLSMGQSAEKMAKENRIDRADQDAFAHRSHERAAAAWARGDFNDEVMPVYVPPKYRETLRADNLVRQDSSLDAYTKLKPVFDRRHGSVTAGNSSPLTDGASALLLMSEDKAKSSGCTIMGYLRSYAFAALDPHDQLLMGPAYASPIALDRAKLSLKDMDLVDMHEAFSAQVLSNTQAFASSAFARDKLGRSEPLGEIDWDGFNVSGGSIALGHPFAATGARQIMQTLNNLTRRDGQFALCTACAAGGLGAAVVLERR